MVRDQCRMIIFDVREVSSYSLICQSLVSHIDQRILRLPAQVMSNRIYQPVVASFQEFLVIQHTFSPLNTANKYAANKNPK